MSDAAFLAAIAADPSRELARLVYADWLDERGDPRGPVLRLEGRLFALPETSDEARELRRELGAVAAGVDVRWWAAVARVHAETGPAFDSAVRFPLNVAGAFYTCGECMACDAPEQEAPELLAPLANDGNLRTYFVRQPETAAEIERACWAIRVCCAADLRYGGTDPKIIARLGNTAYTCDYLVAAYSPTLVPADRPSPAWERAEPSSLYPERGTWSRSESVQHFRQAPSVGLTRMAYAPRSGRGAGRLEPYGRLNGRASAGAL